MDSGPRCVGLLVASFQQIRDRARSQDSREIDQFSESQLWFDAGPAPRSRAGGRSVPVRGRGAGGCAGGRRSPTRLPPALGFHPSPALPSPSRPSLGSRPLPPSPRGGDRRACNLVPFARLEQHLPPSPGTRGSRPNPYEKPETNPSPHATRTRRRGTACSHRQLGTPQVQTPKCHQKLSFSSFHLNKQTKPESYFYSERHFHPGCILRYK